MQQEEEEEQQQKHILTNIFKKTTATTQIFTKHVFIHTQILDVRGSERSEKRTNNFFPAARNFYIQLILIQMKLELKKKEFV